jgi:hypothetical protein
VWGTAPNTAGRRKSGLQVSRPALVQCAGKGKRGQVPFPVRGESETSETVPGTLPPRWPRPLDRENLVPIGSQTVILKSIRPSGNDFCDHHLFSTRTANEEVVRSVGFAHIEPNVATRARNLRKVFRPDVFWSSAIDAITRDHSAIPAPNYQTSCTVARRWPPGVQGKRKLPFFE